MTGVEGPRVGPVGWVPEHDRQHPPFEPGNSVALTHGAKSLRRVEPVAAKYLEAVLVDDAVPYLRELRYRPALVAWAQAEARVALLEEWVAKKSLEEATESGQGRTSPLELLRKWEASAHTHRTALGLTPMSAARLGRDVSQGRQADAASELTRIRAEHEQSQRGKGSS